MNININNKMACVIFGYKVNSVKGMDCLTDIVGPGFLKTFKNDDLSKMKVTPNKIKEIEFKNGYYIIYPNGGDSDLYFGLQYTYLSRENVNIDTKILQPHPDEVVAFINWINKHVDNKYLPDMQYGMWLILEKM